MAASTNIQLPSNSSALPIVRYVYLVQDASDALLMGSTSSNVYTTAQDAYDAADMLSAGGTIPVVIKVGKTKASSVGGITLTASWNTAISLSGINKEDSKIGDIYGMNSVNYGFSVGGDPLQIPNPEPVYMSNITVGNISTNYTGVMTGVEYSGYIMLWLINATVGNLDSSINDPTSTYSTPGFVNVNFSWWTSGDYPGFGNVVGNINASTTADVGVAQVGISNVLQVGTINNMGTDPLQDLSTVYANKVGISGNVDTAGVTFIDVNMNGNLNVRNGISWNGGRISGTISNLDDDLGISVDNMGYISNMNLTFSINTYTIFKGVGEIGVLNIVNNNIIDSQSYPVILINTFVRELSLNNNVFGNTSLVTKNTSFTKVDLVKSIHRNYDGNSHVINAVDVAASYTIPLNSSTVGTFGSIDSLDNFKKILKAVVITNSTANAVTGGLNIGTTLGGSEVISALAVPGNASLYIDSATILQRLFTSLNTSLYIAPVTSMNGAVLSISLIFNNYK